MSLVAQMVKNPPAMRETWVQSQGRSLEEEMATCILAWRIPTDRGAWSSTVHAVAELELTEQLSTHTESCFTTTNKAQNILSPPQTMGCLFVAKSSPPLVPVTSNLSSVSLSLWFCLFQSLGNAVLWCVPF